MNTSGSPGGLRLPTGKAADPSVAVAAGKVEGQASPSAQGTVRVSAGVARTDSGRPIPTAADLLQKQQAREQSSRQLGCFWDGSERLAVCVQEAREARQKRQKEQAQARRERLTAKISARPPQPEPEPEPEAPAFQIVETQVAAAVEGMAGAFANQLTGGSGKLASADHSKMPGRIRAAGKTKKQARCAGAPRSRNGFYDSSDSDSDTETRQTDTKQPSGSVSPTATSTRPAFEFFGADKGKAAVSTQPILTRA